MSQHSLARGIVISWSVPGERSGCTFEALPSASDYPTEDAAWDGVAALRQIDADWADGHYRVRPVRSWYVA